MAAPTIVTTIPRDEPDEPSIGEPRIPRAANTDRAAPMPVVDFGDNDQAPAMWDDGAGDGGTAPPPAEIGESDLVRLYHETGGGSPPQLQPQRRWPAHVQSVFRSAPQAPPEPRLDDGERITPNTPRELDGGDEIQIGQLRMIYHQLDEMATQPVKTVEDTTQRIEVTALTFRLDVIGPPAPFSVVEARGPFEALDDEYPIRLTTGRRLESYNTGAQTNLYSSPLHRGESLDLSPEDAERLELADGEIVRVSSRRGSVEAPLRIDPSLRPGLAFMTFHFPDQVDTNQLTIDVTDPKSGTAEFKAAAIRVDKLEPAEREEHAGVAEPATVGGQE